MEERTLEVKLTSAKDLKNLNVFSKMDVYAVVSLSGNQKIKTPVDRNGGTSPTWNFPVKFTFNESMARKNRLALEIKIRCERALATDKDIGQVHVPLLELLNQPGDGNSFQHVSYQVRKPSGKPKGAFNFSYKFTSTASAPPPTHAFHKLEDPLTAYPAPAVGSISSVAYPSVGSTSSVAYPAVYPPPPPPSQYAAGYGYPPPPPQPVHGYAPQQGYGYGYGYGYPPAPVQRGGKNKFGMGLGAGLLGGALGGLVIGDMISDPGFDAGGFDAGFGF